MSSVLCELSIVETSENGASGSCPHWPSAKHELQQNYNLDPSVSSPGPATLFATTSTRFAISRVIVMLCESLYGV